MAKKKKKNQIKFRKLTKREIKQVKRIGSLVVVAAVVIAAIFGTYKGVSYGIHWFMYRNKEKVNTIIMSDGQKLATATNSVAKKIAASKIAQEEAKIKAQESTDETRKQELASITLEPLKQRIDDYIKEHKIPKDYISYRVIELASGKMASSENSTYNMLAGSVYKLPLCMLWYDRVADGKASLEDKLIWSKSVTEVEGRMQYRWQQGDSISLEDILAYTLKYSDNVGGHMLFDSYGGWEKFKKDAARYSDHEQAEEFYSKENYLNAEYMCDVWTHISKNQEKYEDLIHYLTIAAPDDFLNYSGDFGMVQKVGFVGDHINSTGWSPNGRPYVISVFTNLGDDAYPTMGDINKLAYEYINEELPPYYEY